MDNGSQVRLSASEITQLWTQYMNDSGSICFLSYFLEKAEDEEIKPIIAFALDLSKKHIDWLTGLFKEEKLVIPHGFKLEEDVDLLAPKLYSDTYVLQFILQMAKNGLTTYSGAVAASVREDITNYFMGCISETMELYKRTKEVSLSKGVFIRPPSLPDQEGVEYVKTQGFVWDIFGDKRSLLAAEVANLYSNIQRNDLGTATLTGFSQVAKSKEVTEFFEKGIGIAKKHVKLFAEKLQERDVAAPTSWAYDVTVSTSQTFSDKIMMFFTSGMIGLSIGYYGTAVAQSPRVDLGIMYNRLSVEVQLYSEDGANLMIKNGWLEQPPMAPDRNKLAKRKK